MAIDAPRTIVIDFDGCVVYQSNPFIGEENPGCVDVLKKLINAGHDLILLTMRTDNLLDDAIMWFQQRDIKLFAINCNPMYETGSRKVYGNLYLDDHGINIPLIHDLEVHRKPFVDWHAVDKILDKAGYYKKQHVAQKSVQS